MESEIDLKTLKRKREYWRTRIFWLLIEIAFIFGVPAATGYFLGRFIKSRYGAGDEVFLIILSVTFILSWIVVVFRYRQIKRNLDEVDKEIAKHVAVEEKKNEEDED